MPEQVPPDEELIAQHMARGFTRDYALQLAGSPQRTTRRMQDRGFYTTETLGRSRRVTPDGYLICEGVPIARTGDQIYGQTEIGIQGDSMGRVTVSRPADEVFHADTLASFEGKPLTIDHPPEFVTADNYKQWSVGHVQHVRRGTGDEHDLLICDLVITDAAAIKYVNDELPEISAGYDAQYVIDGPGRATQRRIIGNHVAFVTRGRAGPRVKVRDNASEESHMSTKKGFMDTLKSLFKDESFKKWAEEESEEKEHSEDSATKAIVDAVTASLSKAFDARFKAIEDRLPAKDEACKEDDVEETGDVLITPESPREKDGGRKEWTGKLTADAVTKILERAEILCPGISVPTGDAASLQSAVPDVMVRAIKGALTSDAGKAAVMVFLPSGKPEDIKTLDALHGVFAGAAEQIRVANNAKSRTVAARKTTDFGPRPKTAAEMNAQAEAFWKDKK